MRRTLQVIALLIAILCGSVPGLRLLGAATAGCRCGAVPMDSCPCRTPSRPSGTTAPCAPGGIAPVAALTSPCSAAQSAVRPARSEPSPVPPALLAAGRGRFLDAGPSLLARPGPVPLFDSGPDRLAKLSLLRI